jgi:predicted RNA polymerase sigma factor
LHVAGTELSHRLGRDTDAVRGYQGARQLDPAPAERAHIHRR